MIVDSFKAFALNKTYKNKIKQHSTHIQETRLTNILQKKKRQKNAFFGDLNIYDED